MARETRIDSRILCPFYVTTYRHLIFCAPVAADAEKTANVLKNAEARNDYIDDFCASRCWKNCVIARMCMEKYDEESSQ